jgi:hypothetical protein
MPAYSSRRTTKKPAINTPSRSEKAPAAVNASLMLANSSVRKLITFRAMAISAAVMTIRVTGSFRLNAITVSYTSTMISRINTVSIRSITAFGSVNRPLTMRSYSDSPRSKTPMANSATRK